MILIAGLPSSGNHLVFTHVRRGVEARDGHLSVEGVDRETVQIWHGDNASPNLKRPEGDRVVFVIPVRNEAVRALSIAKRMERQHRRTFPIDNDAMRRNVTRLIVDNDAPWYAVSYEGLVADPNRSARNLFDWLGLPWVRWPEVGSTHQGPVFDANEAHSSSGHCVQPTPYIEGQAT